MIRLMPRARGLAWATLALTLVGLAGAASVEAQDDLDYWKLLALDRAAFRMRPLALMPMGNETGQRVAYGDRYGHLRVVYMSGDSADEEWRSRNLNGPVVQVLVEDLDGDGRAEIVARAVGGRIFVFDDRFNERWQSLDNDYQRISAMTIANMDDDDAYELVLLGGSLSASAATIDYIDGARFTREFRSTQVYQATDMVVGNVDSDDTLELVLNTGKVVDERGEPEWETEAFGEWIDLLDIDGDGIDEVLGYNVGSPMRIWDVDSREEKPLR